MPPPPLPKAILEITVPDDPYRGLLAGLGLAKERAHLLNLPMGRLIVAGHPGPFRIEIRKSGEAISLLFRNAANQEVTLTPDAAFYENARAWRRIEGMEEAEEKAPMGTLASHLAKVDASQPDFLDQAAARFMRAIGGPIQTDAKTARRLFIVSALSL